VADDLQKRRTTEQVNTTQPPDDHEQRRRQLDLGLGVGLTYESGTPEQTARKAINRGAAVDER
jgi:hypothetical protein